MRLKRKYDLASELREIKLELARIAELRTTISTPGWKHVVETFHELIGRLLQDCLDRCVDPEKHKLELMAKKMTADTLGGILAAIDSRVASEEYLVGTLNAKASQHTDAVSKQKLNEI